MFMPPSRRNKSFQKLVISFYYSPFPTFVYKINADYAVQVYFMNFCCHRLIKNNYDPFRIFFTLFALQNELLDYR